MTHDEVLDKVEEIRKQNPRLHPENLGVIWIWLSDGRFYLARYHCLTMEGMMIKRVRVYDKIGQLSRVHYAGMLLVLNSHIKDFGLKTDEDITREYEKWENEIIRRG